MILRQQCYQVGIRKIRGLGWLWLSRPTGRRQPKIVAEALESPNVIIARETAGAPRPPRGYLLSINISKIDVFSNSSINEPPRFIINERNMSDRRISNNYQSDFWLLWSQEPSIQHKLPRCRKGFVIFTYFAYLFREHFTATKFQITLTVSVTLTFKH